MSLRPLLFANNWSFSIEVKEAARRRRGVCHGQDQVEERMREEEGELFLQSEASSLVTVEHPPLDIIIIITIIIMVCIHLLKPHSAGPLIQSSPTLSVQQ